ncbi:MAG: Phi17:2 [Verrucomicrobiales bacterium]|nr:Phi17:2 [Verrucomicrobiales bacterium]
MKRLLLLLVFTRLITQHGLSQLIYKDSPPLTIIGQTNVIISGLRITNASDCGITIKGSKNIRIENCWIGSCAGEAVLIEGCSEVTVTSNRFEHVRSGVYALNSRQIVVTFNHCRNVQGPMPRGQFTQFDKVTGAGNVIKLQFLSEHFGKEQPRGRHQPL